MRRIIDCLVFLMIILSSGAFVQLIKDGGARDQGLENSLPYSGPLNALPFVWIACVSAVFAIFLFNNKFKKIKLPLPFVILLASCFASALWAEFPLVSFRISLFISFALLLINFQLISYGWIHGLLFFEKTLFFILACSIFVIFFIPSYGIAVGAEHAGKWQGVFDHKNSLGNFSSMSFLVFFWQYKRSKSKISLAAAVLAMILAVGSQSGTAIANIVILLFISIILSFSFFESYAYKLRYILLAIFVVLSFSAIFIAIGFQEFSIFEKDSTFSNRNLIWAYIIAKTEGAPWIGYGLDQLGALINKNSAEFFSNVGFVVGSAHNGFLETIFSLGYLGLSLILWVLFDLLRKSKKGVDFNLTICYIVSFLFINTFEAKMIGFNIYLIGLMYVAVAADLMIKNDSKLAFNFINSPA